MSFRVMGMVALQKFIVSLGGIGTSSVGSSTTYAPKELNKEVMPEKVNILIVPFVFPENLMNGLSLLNFG